MRSGSRNGGMVYLEKDKDSSIQLRQTHSYKLSGSCFKQAPLLISLALFVWSMTSFKHSGLQMNILSLLTGESANPCIPSSASDDKSFGGLHMESGQLRRSLKQREEQFVVSGEGEATQGMRPARTMQVARGGLDWVPEVPSLSIFCAPKAYTRSPDDPQRRALLSWLRLSPPPKVVLMGSDESFYDLVREFPGQVFVEPNIDYNFLGVPLFHSMLARAQAADTDLSMIINGDIILINDLMVALQKVSNNFDNWVLTAARWDVAEDFPFSFETSAWAKSKKTATAIEKEIKQFVRSTGSLHTYGGVDFWMWNNSPVPLFAGVMPPFVFGRGKYDNWLTHEIINGGLRQMVDASEAVTSIHVAHSYSHVMESNSTSGKVSDKLSFWSTRKQSSWELFANIHMAQSYGTYTNQKGTALHVPWRLSSCYEPAVLNMCLQKRTRPANCTCEYSPLVQQTQTDAKLRDNFWICGSLSIDKKKDFSIQPIASPKSVAGLPHTMEQLLPQVAKEIDGEQVVILVAVTFGYAEMLMSFVCRLRKLGLADNLVVAALDEDLYRFSFTQGLAVYYEHASTNLKGIDSKECAFGSQCFRQFTKLKSRAVLRVLKAGYSVLWTDVDIVWYTDPLPHLMSFGRGTFPIQSNEPNSTLPGTGIRRINSGFYFARSDQVTIEAFEAITAHAATTKLSEQPSFYDVLCGVKGELLIPGKEECRWTNGLRTIFLDRAAYPNGAVYGFWNEKNPTAACKAKGCAILHNNWISGKDAKKERLVVNGYWHYDADRRMCMHGWHAKLKHVLKSEEVMERGGGISTSAQ